MTTDVGRRGTEATVLRIDPEPVGSCDVCEVLVPAGFRVKTVRTGQEAAQVVGDVRPDILVTDWLMPESWFHGLHLAAALRRLRPELRILLTTDVATPDVAFDGVRVGIQDILPRRVSPEQILHAAHAALRHSPAASEPRSFYPEELLDRILDDRPPDRREGCPFSARALIVESSTEFRRLGVRELERLYCVAHSVEETQWALHLLEADSEIDVVIFGLDRNRTEVIAFVEQLRSRYPDVIRVAQGRDPARLDKLSLHAEHFLEAPWKAKDFRRLLVQ